MTLMERNEVEMQGGGPTRVDDCCSKTFSASTGLRKSRFVTLDLQAPAVKEKNNCVWTNLSYNGWS